MIQVRKSDDRGYADHGWLKARHTFSFAGYQDEQFMGFRALRVINEDRVGPGEGFGTHPHQNAEIFTYVIEGKLQHRDSMGNGSIIEAGNLQYMSAGDGVTHSEFNPSKTEPLHLYQIWVLPNQEGGEPRYGEKNLNRQKAVNQLVPLFSGIEKPGVLQIRQNAEISFGRLTPDHTVAVALKPDRYGWIQVIAGELECLGERLTAGDGAAISGERAFQITAKTAADFLFFDLD